MTRPCIHPSILSADFARLAEELARIPGSDAVHVDVMDGHFVPNLTLGLPVVEAIRAATDLPLDIHLMIEDADRWAPQYAEAGAESVTFHAEAARAPIVLARTLRSHGAKAGMALRPATGVEPYLARLSRRFARAQQWGDAEKLFNALHRAAPAHPELGETLGMLVAALCHAGRREQAAVFRSQLQQLAPGSAALQVLGGV